jgi:hypothetical protein
MIFAFVLALSARRTRWAACAGWFSLVLIGQAATLQLLDVGPRVKLQLFHEWGVILGSYRVYFLVAVVAQGIAVAWKAARLWAQAKVILAGIVTRRQAILFLLLLAFASSTVVPEFPQAFIVGGLARALLRLTWQSALGLLTAISGMLSLLFATLAIPGDAWESLQERWQQVGPRTLVWACAAWVVLISSLFAWFVFDRMPHIPDEVSYLYQAKYLAAGQLYLPPPPVPDAFFDQFFMIGEGRWYSSFPAGWPAALAAGYWVGAPWLINALLGGIAILLAHALLTRLYSATIAGGVALLLAVSPWMLFMSGSFMAHPVTLVLALLCLVGTERAKNAGSIVWGAVAGLSAGGLLHTRPLDAVIVAGVAGLWWVATGWKRIRPAALTAAVLGGATMTVLFLAYNQVLTGDPLLMPLTKHLDQIHPPGSNRLGFGSDIGNWGWTGLDPLPGHGPIDVLINTNLNLYMSNFELFGWTCGSLLFFFLLLTFWRPREDGLMWGLVLAVVGIMNLYWFSGGPDLGARYWYVLILPFAALTLRGAQALASRLEENGASPATAARVWGFLILAGLASSLTVIPWRGLDKYPNYRGIRSDIRALESRHHFGRSLVLIRGQYWPDYAAAFIFNPPTLATEADGPIYALDLGPETRAKLVQYYADRPVWIVAGPTETGGSFRIVEGPIHPKTGSGSLP